MTKKILLAASIAAAMVVLGAAPALGQTTTLTCVPSSSSVVAGNAVTFFFGGGNGTFSITGNGIATTTTNTSLSTTFPASGTGALTLSSGGQTVACSVNVTAAGTTPVMCNVPTGTITVGIPATFTATGGNGTFNWASTDLNISNPLGSSFTATYTAPGVHTLNVTSNGQTASCSFNVSPAAATTGTLACSPATQTAFVGQTVRFTATGGDGANYVWSATDLRLVSPVGSGFSATYGAAGVHNVTVTSGSQNATCSVTVDPLSGGTPGLPNTGFAPVGK